MNRIRDGYFQKNPTLFIARDLIGRTLVRDFGNGKTTRFRITETEAYIGEEDLACHARFGKTKRNKIMYESGGKVYVYLIYGIYWMLNIVTAAEDCPEAVLIRALSDCSGPGRVGKLLKLDKSFYGENLSTSKRIWIANSKIETGIISDTRIGIDYAGEIWKNKAWRFVADSKI